MNSREKFLSVMRMNDSDYNRSVEVPKVEFGYWAGVIRRWEGEGLKIISPVPDDYSDGIAIMANRNIYSEEILKKTDTHIWYKDSYGVTNKNDINYKYNIPSYGDKSSSKRLEKLE
jgi:hypothetical protein